MGCTYKKPTRERLQAACDRSDATSCFDLAESYLEESLARSGYPIADVGYRFSTLYAKACSLGEGKACSQRGLLLSFSGLTKKQREEKNMKMFERGCELDDPESCELLGGAYFHGGIVEKSKVQSMRFLQKGCKLDSASACTLLAWGYKDELGFLESEKLLEKACGLGFADGCFVLGRFEVLARTPANFRKAERAYVSGCELKGKSGCTTAQR